MRRLKKFLLNQRGFSLAEIMVAIGATGVVVMIVSTFISGQMQSAKEIEYSMNLRAIANKIETQISNTNFIIGTSDKSSPTGNFKLKKCITPMATSSNSCDTFATDMTKHMPILFYASVGSRNVPIAGPYKDENPKAVVLYRLRDGSRCDEATGLQDSSCNVEARSYFWATCPADSSVFDDGGMPMATVRSCPTAATIHLRYQVRIRENIKASTLRRSIPPIPHDQVFWKDPETRSSMTTFGAISIPVSYLIGQDQQFRCPPNYTMTAIIQGKPECKCLYPYKEKDPINKICLADEFKCPENTRYRGTDKDGTPLPCTPILCEYVTVANNNDLDEFDNPELKTETGCRQGGWIESMYPEAREPPKDESGSDKEVPPSSCITVKPCTVGKNGGVCEASIKCYTRIHCCYDVSEFPAP